jgi:solute:Na+ symporter, SSS family
MDKFDYWVIMVFSVIIVTAGMSFGRKGGDMKSFFAAGGSVPWSINGLSLFMSFFSAGTFVVWGSIAYQYGWVAITIQWTMSIAGFVVGRFIAAKWRDTNVLTAAEFINKRFGTTVQQFYSYVFLLLSLGYTGAFLYPVAKLVNVSTGLGIEEAIILLGVLIIVYTATGGLWAVVVTDVLQFVILTAAVILVIPLAFQYVGGWNNVINATPEGFFNLLSGEYSLGFVIAFAFYNTVFIGGNWAYVQRYTSVKNKRSAKKVGYLFGGLYIVSPVIWMIPPMLYNGVDPGLTGLETEGAYLLMCQKALPIGMLGLMLGGMIFATASSVNTSLNMAAAVLTNDIFKQFNPNASRKSLMVMARLSTLLFGVGTVIVALLVPGAGGIVEVVLSIGAVTGVSLYGPPIWGLYSKRITGKAILWITVTSLSINIFFKLLSPSLLELRLDRAWEMIMGISVPLSLLAAYEIYAAIQNRTAGSYLKYKKIQNDSDSIQHLEDNENKNQNAYGISVIAYALGSIGLLFIVLGIVAKKGILLMILLGIGIIALGIILTHLAHKMRGEKTYH